MNSPQHQLLATGLILSLLFLGSISCYAKASPPSPAPLIHDVLIAPDLAAKNQLLATPSYLETSEYMIGNVAVGVVLLESNGAIDPSTEDWTADEETQVANEIQDALDWWSAQNPSAGVTFTVTWNYRVPTSYEPINRPQSDQNLWIHEAMSSLGYPGVNYFTQVRGYVNALRNSAGTDWAFAMFIVDSSNDADGCFTDFTSGGWHYFAYAYIGGPFLVMTYDNDGWGIGNMDRVTAHEMGHIFYATDEYDGEPEYSGYLNVLDVDGSGALMDENTLLLSTGTRGQIGWRDSDGDGIQDIVDTVPNTILSPHFPDPTYTVTLTYSGSVTEIPYPNSNPYGTSIDLTINTINLVQYRVDYGAWLDATAADGAFDEATEAFTFTTPPLSVGTHTIETRGINSVGNAETSYASDVVTILGDPVADFTYSPENPVVNETVTFDATSSTANGGATVNYDWDFGDGNTDSGVVVTHAYDSYGVFAVTLNVTDNEERWDAESNAVTVKSRPVANFMYSPAAPYVGETVTFDAQTSYDSDGSLSEYSWDFGDGNITSTANQIITHAYGAEDTYPVKLTVTDNDGLNHSVIKPVTATEDFTPPTTVHDYDGSWHTTDFNINLAATDDFIGVAETYYRINDGPTLTVNVDGQPFIATQGDNNSLEYWSVDNAENEELPHNILTDIKLDKTAPTGSISVNNGDAYTISTSVMLTLTATDETSGVYLVQFSNDGVWDTESWEVYSPTKVWVLASGDGTKTVYYQIMDNAGLVSGIYSDAIILDTASPAGSIVIDGEATYVTANTVTLTLSATDEISGVYQVRFSNDGVWDTESWEVYSSTKVWVLASGDGTKTVYYQVMDRAGLVSELYSASVILDSTPPAGSVTINNGDAYTNSTAVTLTLTAADATSGVYLVRFSNDDVWDTESWEAYSPTRLWFLESGDGTKTVYYQIMDNVGLVSETISASILLDTNPPSGSITINNEATYAASTSVTLTLTATDATSGITEMRFSAEDVSWTDWEAYSDSKVWTFTADEGTKIVYYQVMDQLGLVSDVAFDTIILDTKPPTILDTSPNNGTEIRSSTVTASWSGVDETSGIDHYRVRLNDGSWINTGTNTEYTFTGANDGNQVLDIIAVDRANNFRQVQICFSVNTSLIGGPGWNEEILVFAAIVVAISVAAAFFIIRRAHKK